MQWCDQNNCASNEDFECVKKLIENGTDVNFLKSNDNASALIVTLQAIEANARPIRVMRSPLSTNSSSPYHIGSLGEEVLGHSEE